MMSRTTWSLRHPDGMTQQLAVADLLVDGGMCLSALASGHVDIVYSDPPWSPGNEKWWRQHAGLEPPESYDHLLDAWCAAVAILRPRHVFCEQSVNPAHQGMFLTAVGRCRGWSLPLRQTWTIIYGAPRRPNALLHFGWCAVAANPDGMSGPAILREVLLAARVDAGTTIADPCTGLGTTSRVAHELGCHFVGTELNAQRLGRTAGWLLRHGYRP